MLEGTIPNAKEVEAILIHSDGSLAEIHKNIEGLEMGHGICSGAGRSIRTEPEGQSCSTSAPPTTTT
eukprot:909571-Prorocentrum_lima.AAC.1